MRCYVDEELLKAVKCNFGYPQVIRVRENQFLNFYEHFLIVRRFTCKGETIKCVDLWEEMSAENINKILNEMEWVAK